MRRTIFTICLLTVLIALPAYATTTTLVDDSGSNEQPVDPGDPAPVDTNTEGPSAAAVLAGLATFGLIVKAIVAAVRKSVPTLQGLATMGVASLAGTLLAALFDFQTAAALADQYNLTGVVNRVPDGVIGWIISGIAIGAASGFFAELGGTSGPRSMPARVVVNVEDNDEANPTWGGPNP